MIDAFYSDPHFGHNNIIKYQNRPFENAFEMDQELIKRYNELIKPEHLVLWCGDCFFTSFGLAQKIFDQLNGRKILIRGNHDMAAYRMAELGFEVVMDECKLFIAGRHVRVSHYPSKKQTSDHDVKHFHRRPTLEPDELLIHGHVHGKNKIVEKEINVSCDAWDYKPVMMEQIEELIKTI